MRTTITIDDGVLELAKKRARAQGTTLGKVVEEALRAVLFQHRGAPRPPPFELVTFHGDGVHEGIDLDRTSALLAAEDVARYRRKR